MRKVLPGNRDAVLSFARVAAWCAAFFGTACFASLWFFRRPRRLDRAVLLLAGGFGLFALVLYTPFSPPDERFHWQQSLRHSVAVWERPECASSWLDLGGMPEHRNRPDGWLRLEEVSGRSGGGETVRMPKRCGNLLLHLPQTAGVAAARAVGAPPMAAFCAGRLFGLLFWLAAVCAAVRIAPAFRTCIATTALVPTATMVSASFSYDLSSLALSLLAFAALLRACSSDKPFTPRALAAGAALVAAGAFVKWASAPFLPLMLAIPSKRFGGRRGKAAAFVFAVFVFALAAAMVADSTPARVHDSRFGLSAWSGAGPLALSEWLRRPDDLVRMLVRTSDALFRSLLFETFGSVLGGRWIAVPDRITAVFMALFLLSAVRTGEDRFRGRPPRAAALAAAAAIVVSVVFLMLLTWTPPGAKSVEGLQGRYFLPALPLFAFAVAARSGRDDADEPGFRPECGGVSSRILAVAALAHVDVVLTVLRESMAHS